MTTKQRTAKLQAHIQKQRDDFWKEFSDAELDAIRRREPEAIRAYLDKFKRLGGEKILSLYHTVETPEERAETERIADELAKEFSIPRD